MAGEIFQRIDKDKDGNMFIPMNVEGVNYNENFMTTTKYVWLFLGIITPAVLLFAFLQSAEAKWPAYAVGILGWLVITQFITRYVIFEERFYHRMYKKMQDSEITTPGIFWDIASIKETSDGCILTYMDAKIGVLIRLERDTIVGKEKDFKEIHYGAVSNFYKALNTKGLSYVQMNIMEHAGKDPRLNELSLLTTSSSNANIRKLMEMEIGYIKSITHKTLYETDYFLIYTRDSTKVDTILNDIEDCTSHLMDGAFINYDIMDRVDIIEFIKEEYGVRYFDYTEATLGILKENGISQVKPFELYGVRMENGDVYVLDAAEINRLRNAAKKIQTGAVRASDIVFEEQILKRGRKAEIAGIDFNKLGNTNKAIEEVKKTKETRDYLPKIPSGLKNKLKKADSGSMEDELLGFGEDLEFDDALDFEEEDLEVYQGNNNEQNKTKKTRSSSKQEDDDDFIDFA